jgi:hypothetical protein
LCIAREALLDIKFRRQSRIYFANALRTTLSICPRWIGFSEDDSFARVAKRDRLLPLARRNLGGGGLRRCDQHDCQKKIKKSWSSVQIFDMPLQTTGKNRKTENTKSVDAFLAF